MFSREALIKDSVEHQIRLFLHESAHAFLGHDGFNNDEIERYQNEAEAWAQVETWIGPATDGGYYEKRPAEILEALKKGKEPPADPFSL